MRYLIITLHVFLLLLFSPFFSMAQETSKKPKQQWTLEQVKEMAKKYNLQDSITSTNNFFLMYVDKKAIEVFLQKANQTIKAKSEFAIYAEKTKYVRTFDDYVNLANSLPSIRKALVDSHGGEFKYQLYNRDARKYKWRIYRKEQGSLSFERADLPIAANEANWGKRIDNLPKE